MKALPKTTVFAQLHTFHTVPVTHMRNTHRSMRRVPAMSATVKLLIKSPTGQPSTFELAVAADATLADVQVMLARTYDGNPTPEQQTLIYAGKVLKEPSVTIRQLIEQARSEPFEGPHSFHLVVRKATQQAAPAGSEAGPSSSTSTSTSTGTTAPGTGVSPPVQVTPAPAQPAAAAASPSVSQAPPASTPEASAPSTSAAAEGSTSTAAPADAGTPAPQPYFYVNPVYAAAYQAAYAAALAASMQQAGAMAQAAQASATGQPMAPMQPFMMPQLFPQGFMPMAGFTPGQPGQPQQHGQFPHMAYGAVMQQPMIAHFMQGGMHGPEIRIEGLPQEALGPVAMALANLRQRRGVAAGAGHAGVAGHPHHAHGRRRPRGIMVRISVRTMLQILVFAMVLYQHFMWHRFIALVVGGLVLYLTTAWGPLRRALAYLQQPPPPPAQRQPAPQAPGQVPAAEGAAAAAPAAGGEAGDGQAAGAAGAPAAGAAQPAQPPRPRGVLQELLVLLLGFVTSLLPAWNYNPDDAAAFAAAQDIAAREDRARALQQGEGAAVGADGANGGAAAREPEAAAGDVGNGVQGGAPAAVAQPQQNEEGVAAA